MVAMVVLDVLLPLVPSSCPQGPPAAPQGSGRGHRQRGELRPIPHSRRRWCVFSKVFVQDCALKMAAMKIFSIWLNCWFLGGFSLRLPFYKIQFSQKNLRAQIFVFRWNNGDLRHAILPTPPAFPSFSDSNLKFQNAKNIFYNLDLSIKKCVHNAFCVLVQNLNVSRDK